MKNRCSDPYLWLLTVLLGCGLAASSAAAGLPEAYRHRQAGSGGPVVVFEYGLGDKLETWKTVQDEVSRFTGTFSYNRAGYEGSPAAHGIRDAATVVGELRALLAEQGVPPPYVLVGHSLGGLFMQFYARNFPDEVAGLVLVDSSHWDQSGRIRAAAPALAADVSRERRKLSGVLGMEGDAFDLSGREVRDSPPLRHMPLVVLSAGQHSGATSPPELGSQVRPRRGLRAEFWLGLQRELAGQLPDAQQTIVRGSGHFIQAQQPQVVLEAVHEVVAALRGQ